MTRNTLILNGFIQFTCINLDACQKEGGNFFDLLQKEGGIQKKKKEGGGGGVPSEKGRGGANPGGNYDISKICTAVIQYSNINLRL